MEISKNKAIVQKKDLNEKKRRIFRLSGSLSPLLAAIPILNSGRLVDFSVEKFLRKLIFRETEI
jgi:hypothetical protein